MSDDTIKKIYISSSPTADTRSCDASIVSKGTLEHSSALHIQDVRAAIGIFISLLKDAAESHDKDKLEDLDLFHKCFVTNFKDREWLDHHYLHTRHHLLEPTGVPVNVNLLDVLEMLADWVTAGLARNNKVRPLTLPTELLTTAVANTIKLLERNIEVTDPKSNT